MLIATKENSQGSDGIHPIVLMELAGIVLESLAIILQKQWRKAKLPELENYKLYYLFWREITKARQPTRGITEERLQIWIAKPASKAVSVQPATKAHWNMVINNRNKNWQRQNMPMIEILLNMGLLFCAVVITQQFKTQPHVAASTVITFTGFQEQ